MLNELEMQQIDDMLEKIETPLDKYTIEKWKNIIEREMKELGFLNTNVLFEGE